MKIRTGTVAAALALTAATTIAVAPAHAAPAPAAQTGVVQYIETTPGFGSADGGSLDNPIVAAGLVLIAGVAVSVAMAVGAGVAAGGIEIPEIPGLPF